MYVEKKPIKRSKLRHICGELYYTLKRRVYWTISNKTYSKEYATHSQNLPYVAFSHKTPLYRKLKNVDMWLQENKVINLKIAIKSLDKLILKPGEYFSYWKLLGKPSYKKGYVDGMSIMSDGSIKPGVAGGLCQLSNLIYWMTLHTDLTVTERYRHSHDVFPDSGRTQPFGSGATCHYNFLDLEIYNGTKNTYELTLNVSEDYLEGQWLCSSPLEYSYEVYESEHSITSSGFGGYIRHNIIKRKVFDKQNNLIDDEYITENHAYMVYNPYLYSSNPSK